jgi:hypothetical protein
MFRTFLPLIVATVCLLTSANVADAQPYRLYPTAPPSYYQPGRMISPGVVIYPQVVTTPRYYYYPTFPTYQYSYSTYYYTPYYTPYPSRVWYGGTYSPYGTYFWYRIR